MPAPPPPPPPYPLRRPASTPYFHPFFNFSGPPPWEVIKICFLLFKKGGGWVRTMIDNYNYWNLLSVYIKDFFVYEVYMKIFLLFTIIYSKINMNECCGNNFALAIICQHTLEKIQISLCKSLNSCWVLRRILKAV